MIHNHQTILLEEFLEDTEEVVKLTTLIITVT